MKKLILLIAITMMAVSTGLSLEPTRVSVYAPAYQAGTPASNVRVDLVDYNGGATTLFTGHTYTTGDAEVTADDNGVITINVGQNAGVAAAWDAIEADDMNTFWTFDVYINGTLYSQGRVDQQVIIQANTSIFNSSGVLVPSGNPSTVGSDNQRFDAVYVKEIETGDPELEGVFIGPTGSAGSAELALQYDNTAGEGIISSNGAAIMNFDANGVDLNGKILDNVAEINDGNQALAISGAFTANQAANTIGDGNDVLQLTIDGVASTQPVSTPNYELIIDGDAKMDYLEVSGFSLTGDFNMNGNTLYDVREIVGATGNSGALLLNTTSSASPVWTANGPITTGTGLFTINGNLDATAGVDVTGGDLTVNDGTNDIFVVDESAGDIFLGASAAEGIYVNGEVQTNIVPGSSSLTLGTDADRWLGAYFLGNSVHVGDANGDDTAELEIGWASDVATFAVNGTTPQFAIDATSGSEITTFDPAGDGNGNLFVEEGGVSVDTDNAGTGTRLSITQATIGRNSGSTETLGLVNSGAGVLDVTIDGKINVQSAASTIGDNTDNTQLTIDGLVGSNNVLVVEGNTDIDGTLNADGNTTLNANVTLGDADTDEINPLGDYVNNITPDETQNTLTLGEDDKRWADLYVLGTSVHVGPEGGEGSTELNIGYASNAATLNVNGATNNQLTIDAANDLVAINASDDAVAELTIDPTDAAVGFVVNSNSSTGAEITSNASGINLDVDGDGTNNFSSNNTAINLNATDDANNEVEISASGVVVDANSDGTDNYTLTSTEATVNTGGATDLVITEGTIERNNTATETLVFQNTDGSNVLDVDIEGKIDVQSAASTMGDNTDATQLTIDGLVGSNDVLVVEGNTDIDGTLNADGNTTLQEDVDLGSATDDLISFAGRVDTDIVPNADNSVSLGTDALRWADVFVNGGSVHVGNANGAGTGAAELNIGWASDVATLNVNNAAAAQLSIDATATSEQITLDPVGDGTNYTFADASATINTGGNEDLVITEEGANRNNAAAQTFAFANSNGTAGANLNVTIDGDLDVAEQITGPNTGHSLGTAGTDGTVLTIAGLENSGADELVVDGDVQIDGTTNIDGVLTANAAGNTIGANTDALQLTIDGDITTAAIDFLVDGDTDINGILNVDGASTLVGVVDAQSAGNTIGDGNDAVQLTVEGDDALAANNALVVDGHTDLQGNVILGSANTENITVNGEFVSDLIPNTTAENLDLGSTAKEWQDLHLSNDANIGNNAVVENELRLVETAGTSDYVGFVAPASVTTSQIWTLPAADGSANQQLITDGGGNLSWGSTSLQVAYEGGNNITTSNAEGNVEIFGTENLDVRVPILNGTGTAVEINDELDLSGDLDIGAGNFTVDASNGNTVVGGTINASGTVTANSGLNVTGANFTVGGSNFVVTTGGATTIQGLVSANAGLNVTGANFTVGASNLFQVNETNGNTTVGGILDQSTGNAIGAAANVISISGTGATYSTASMSGTHQAGSVVHISFPDGLNSVTDTRGTKSNIFGCTVVKDGNGDWYIVSVYE